MAYEANTGMAISHRQPLTRQHRKLHRDKLASINLASAPKSANLLNVIDITKYSTLYKTLRVTVLGNS